jgi:hypothetical protein
MSCGDQFAEAVDQYDEEAFAYGAPWRVAEPAGGPATLSDLPAKISRTDSRSSPHPQPPYLPVFQGAFPEDHSSRE